jgi:cytochrome c
MKAVAPIAITALAPFLLAANGMPSGDAETGEAYFTQNCMMCHSVTPGAKGGVGPNLRGLGGAVSGAGEFRFTAALKNAHITWSEQTLDRFLAAPSQEVPGTMMVTSIDDPQKRADVVAYLLSLR